MKSKKSIIFLSVATVILVAFSLCESVGAEQNWRAVTIGPEGNLPFNCLMIPDMNAGDAYNAPLVIYEREFSDGGSSFSVARRKRGGGGTGGGQNCDCPDWCPVCPWN